MTFLGKKFHLSGFSIFNISRSFSETKLFEGFFNFTISSGKSFFNCSIDQILYPSLLNNISISLTKFSILSYQTLSFLKVLSDF